MNATNIFKKVVKKIECNDFTRTINTYRHSCFDFATDLQPGKIRRSNSYKPMNYRQADNLAESGKKLKGWF